MALIWGALTAKVRGWLIGAGAVIAVLWLAYSKGRQDAARREQNKRTQDTLRKMRTAKEVEDEIDSLDDVGLADRAAKWVRNPPK